MIVKSVNERSISNDDKTIRILNKSVGYQPCSITIDTIELNSKDVRDLLHLSPEELHKYLCLLVSRMRLPNGR